MSFPPQPPPDDPRSGQGGGFGPPPGGFGPPQHQPQQPQPYQPQPYQPQQAPQAPYQQQPQPGGYGGYPPPQPPPRSGGGAKIAALVIGAVVLIAVIVGGLAVALGGGDDGKDAAASSSSPAASATTSSQPTDPTDTGTSPAPGETFRKYVVLDVGQCFNDPGLDSSVTEVTPVPCNGPHDAEVIAHEKITGTYATEAALKTKVLKLCEADAGKRLDHITDSRTFYYYALYPKLAGYQVQGKDTVSCSLTLSNKPDGEKLTKPLS
ncbi:hypothetical protein ABZ883_31165 [Streptomyces sp. NPDC046977]|uniref:hypothetical protein n=1 Tax=Streptomyces sp. NPDC046977 TaxID=3154703 RepID=UPI0033C75172